MIQPRGHHWQPRVGACAQEVVQCISKNENLWKSLGYIMVNEAPREVHWVLSGTSLGAPFNMIYPRLSHRLSHCFKWRGRGSHTDIVTYRQNQPRGRCSENRGQVKKLMSHHPLWELHLNFHAIVTAVKVKASGSVDHQRLCSSTLSFFLSFWIE